MDFKESTPIYLQIANRICNEILTGKFPENERIPSVREYAASLEVNANTVVRSYDYLQGNEVIFNKRGIGYFVSPGAVSRILQIRRNLFMTMQLEEFFKEIDVLKISISEIVELYNKRKK
ncbi:MAG: GntR family transcriptional regulator [Bacteroidales bacterium]|nr:GntR family transcriptional regulator [Bacteroidales bacterium]